MSERAVTIFQAGDSTLEYSVDGGVTWYEVPFIGDVEMPGSPAPTSEVVTRKGVGQVVGKERTPQLNVSIPSYAPHLASFTDLRTARDAGRTIKWRFTTIESTVQAGGAKRCAIAAATGAVTFSEDVADLPNDFLKGDSFGVGLVIEIGEEKHILDTISADGAATVRPKPDADVAAAAFEIKKPSLRQAFDGQIVESAGWSFPADSQLTSSMTIQPNAMPPQFVVV